MTVMLQWNVAHSTPLGLARHIEKNRLSFVLLDNASLLPRCSFSAETQLNTYQPQAMGCWSPTKFSRAAVSSLLFLSTTACISPNEKAYFSKHSNPSNNRSKFYTFLAYISPLRRKGSGSGARAEDLTGGGGKALVVVKLSVIFFFRRRNVLTIVLWSKLCNTYNSPPTSQPHLHTKYLGIISGVC